MVEMINKFPDFTRIINQPEVKIRKGRSGVHVFNRVSGLNILLNEIHVDRSQWARAPRQVSISLTNACDLSCPYCYAPKKPARLQFERVLGWLNELDNNGCLGVGFGGGEPTLYPNLAKLCDYAAKNTRLAVTITTHGHHLDENLISSLAGNVHFVRISIDGIGSTYEMLRGRPFKDLCYRLEKMHNLAPFGINFVVNKQTFADLDAAVTLANNVGATEFLLLPEQPVNGIGGIDNQTRSNLLKWVNSYYGGIRLCISGNRAEGFPTCDPFENEIELTSFAHVDASETLKRTSYAPNGILIDGNGLMKALNKLWLVEEWQ